MLAGLLVIGTFLTVFVLILFGGWIMSAVDDLKAILTRIDVATTNIAADLSAIKAKIGTGMSDVDVAEVQAGLEAAAAKLESLDAENPEGQA